MVRPESKRVLGLEATLNAEAGIHNGVDYAQFVRMASFNKGKRRSTTASIARTMDVSYHTAEKYVLIFDEEQKNRLKPIPSFANEDEEREFWATHDSTEYIDWTKAQTNG